MGDRVKAKLLVLHEITDALVWLGGYSDNREGAVKEARRVVTGMASARLVRYANDFAGQDADNEETGKAEYMCFGRLGRG